MKKTREIVNATNDEEQRRCAYKIFGAKLGSLREQQGLSQESISHSTRIGLPFIVALENGDVEKLPGHIFARGFIKNIAKALGQDGAGLLQEFEDCSANKDETAKQSSVQTLTPGTNRVTSGTPNKKLTAIQVSRETVLYVAAVVVLIGGGIYFGASPETTTSVVSPTTASTDDEANVESTPEAALPVVSVPEETNQLATVIPTPQPEAVKESIPEPVVPVSNKQILELKVTNPVKIRLIADGKTKTRELKPDLYEFSFEETAELMIYDAAAIDLKFNGRSLGPLGNKGRVRKLSFSAQ